MKTKNQKGITLIALIITIIVMLILVGVSVSVALNTGLFKTAQGAAKNTKSESESETELSTGLIKVWNETTKTYNNKNVRDYLQQEPEHEITPEVGEYVSYSVGGINTWRVGENEGQVVLYGIASAASYNNSLANGEVSSGGEYLSKTFVNSKFVSEASCENLQTYVKALTGKEYPKYRPSESSLVESEGQVSKNELESLGMNSRTLD